MPRVMIPRKNRAAYFESRVPTESQGRTARLAHPERAIANGTKARVRFTVTSWLQRYDRLPSNALQDGQRRLLILIAVVTTIVPIISEDPVAVAIIVPGNPDPCTWGISAIVRDRWIVHGGRIGVSIRRVGRKGY